MLIEFTVANYLSFKDPVTFSMVSANSVKEHSEENTFLDATGKLTLLKSAALYGANGSGKSNLITSLGFMKRFILTSFQEALLEERKKTLELHKFLLHEECDHKPSLFEIVFIHEKSRYRYGFEYDGDQIQSEWLFTSGTTKEIPLFSRDNEKITCNQRSFKEGKGLEDKTRQNVLFLSVAAQFNGDISNQVLEWFKNLGIISGLDDIEYKYYTITRLKEDKAFSQWVKAFVSFLDIEDITTEPMNFPSIDQDSIPDEDIKAIFEIVDKIKSNRDNSIERVITWHNKYNNSDIIIGRKPFDCESQESAGSKKLISLLGPLYDTLQNGHILIADELDSRFHPLLTIKIVDFFHKTNTNSAQLLFASHDTNLLKKELFRRDQIWFTEKDKYGATDLYSLVEYREHVRKDASYGKNYLLGKYGAIPFFGDIDEILELIYAK